MLCMRRGSALVERLPDSERAKAMPHIRIRVICRIMTGQTTSSSATFGLPFHGGEEVAGLLDCNWEAFGGILTAPRILAGSGAREPR